MKNLVILNEGPYGNEHSYNGLRLALGLAKSDGEQLRLFLIGDAAACAKHGQKTPNGYLRRAVIVSVFPLDGCAIVTPDSTLA